MEIVVIYLLFVSALFYSLYKDRNKTKKAFFVGKKAFLKLLPQLLIITGLVGLLLGYISPDIIEAYLGEDAGMFGTMLAAVFGSITLIPNIIAMPLAGSLLRSGAAVVTVAALITTLTMVGTVTFPLEAKTFGSKFALLRNVLSFVAAILIAILIGVIL